MKILLRNENKAGVAGDPIHVATISKEVRPVEGSEMKTRLAWLVILFMLLPFQ